MLTLARRVVTALSLAGMIAAMFRLRGKGGVPPQSGGWREITPAELKKPNPAQPPMPPRQT